MAYATVDDVADRWTREFTDEEIVLIETRLEDIERKIRRVIPDLATKVSDQEYLEDVKQIEADAVLRLVRNPEGYISESDGNYTYMLARDLASGKLEILDEEWETLGVFKTQFAVIVPRLVMPT
jgi:hypothetical protein